MSVSQSAGVMSAGERPEPGLSTATPLNVEYRVSRFANLITGRWLDLGCADGGYSAELLRRGADEVVGVDTEADRVASATARNLPHASFRTGFGEDLPFPDGNFDGVFMNEVFEHVTDEQATLAQIYRVLRPGGHLVLISPNRWFPFEGHGFKAPFFETGNPVPLVPWLPKSLVGKWMRGRNYWPRELTRLMRNAGFTIEYAGFIWPTFESYPWLPARFRDAYQARIRAFDEVPGLRRFGISNLIVGRTALRAISPQREGLAALG
jgi:SAM-dependent methyltransferase